MCEKQTKTTNFVCFLAIKEKVEGLRKNELHHSKEGRESRKWSNFRENRTVIWGAIAPQMTAHKKKKPRPTPPHEMIFPFLEIPVCFTNRNKTPQLATCRVTNWVNWAFIRRQWIIILLYILVIYLYIIILTIFVYLFQYIFILFTIYIYCYIFIYITYIFYLY